MTIEEGRLNAEISVSFAWASISGGGILFRWLTVDAYDILQYQVLLPNPSGLASP